MKLALKVSPGAKKSQILGWERDYPQVGLVLRVRIAAPPLDGKANKELVAFISKLLKFPRNEIKLLHGSSGRIKLLELPDEAMARIVALGFELDL